MNIISSLKNKLKKEKLDGVLISKPANVSYLSEFTGEESYLLITHKKAIFITDFRYQQQAKIETENFNIEIVGESDHFKLIARLIEKNNLKRIGFEAKHISYGEVSKIRDSLKYAEFVPTYDLVENFRVIKTAKEIKIIKKAIRINLSVLAEIAKQIKPGRRENDLAAFIEYKMRLKGASSRAFDTIVLSGKNSSLPHARPLQKVFKNNEVVLVDAGACYKGYNCDLTRVFFLGKMPAIIKKIYTIVKSAQQMAIDAIRPGIKACLVDAVARDYIKKQGWVSHFGHSLGHGVGREVHEAPSISAKSKEILNPGMVFTIEPAIYIPNIGGVRIEDMILVTEKKAEVLSK